MAVLPKVDVCMIGIGAAGGVLAKELTTAGMKVVALDLGPFRRTKDYRYLDELRFARRRELLQPKLSETPMRLRLDDQSPASPFVPWTISVGVGGGTVHFGTWHWRLLPHHFRIRSDTIARYGESALPEGSNIVDWPITYEELEPYYARVDTEIGISGKAGNINGQIQTGGNPFEGPRSAEYPMPPLRQTTGTRLMIPAAEGMGYKPFPTPTAIISQDYQGRPACTACGFCSSYGCFIGAKSSTLVSVIPVAFATGNLEIRSECRAIRINQANGTATSVTYLDPAGVEQEQPASLIILACYTWEVVRLLLMSGINDNGMVGKYFMSHMYQFTRGYFEDTITNVSVGPSGANNTLDEFNGDNFDHTGLGFIEGASITTTCGNTQAIGGVGNVPPGTPVWGSGFKEAVKKYFNRNMGFLAQLPALPYEANYLDLDPTVKDALGLPVIRITYNAYNNELKSAEFLQGKMEGLLQEMGVFAVSKGNYYYPPQANHEVGGARMGNDPANSVVNRYCQSHQLPNLFVASGAVFPTYFGYNPTHQIEALAYWTGDYINSEAGSGGSLAKYF